MDFYLHAEHKFIVPAATELLNDEESMGMPTLASKTAIFVAHALRALPAEAVGSVVSSLPFVLQDQRLLLAILRLAGLPQTRELFERLAIRIRQSGDRVSCFSARPAQLQALVAAAGAVCKHPLFCWSWDPACLALALLCICPALFRSARASTSAPPSSLLHLYLCLVCPSALLVPAGDAGGGPARGRHPAAARAHVGDSI